MLLPALQPAYDLQLARRVGLCTVHTAKSSVGNNDLGYPISPEATGLRPSMQPTGNNVEITPEDYSGSSVALAVISDIE